MFRGKNAATIGHTSRPLETAQTLSNHVAFCSDQNRVTIAAHTTAMAIKHAVCIQVLRSRGFPADLAA